MSRSNPTADYQKHPCQFWMEWKGSKGVLEYYDKGKKQVFQLKCPFTFIVLDQLATIRGYNKTKQDGLYSNEVRDTRAEIMVVKYNGGRVVAEGFYTAIKKDIVYEKGHFTRNCYIAFKDGNELRLGCIQFQGCSLNPWREFFNENRDAVRAKAVTANVGQLDTSGSVQFYPPVFAITDISKETDEKAKVIDKKLQEFLTGYLNRTKSEQVASPPSAASRQAPAPEDEPPLSEPEPPPEEDAPF